VRPVTRMEPMPALARTNIVSLILDSTDYEGIAHSVTDLFVIIGDFSCYKDDQRLLYQESSDYCYSIYYCM
jgi:hypothetical protein